MLTTYELRDASKYVWYGLLWTGVVAGGFWMVRRWGKPLLRAILATDYGREALTAGADVSRPTHGAAVQQSPQAMHNFAMTG